MLPIRRRELLLTGLLAGCDTKPGELRGGWVGAHADRGHRLRGELPRDGDGPIRRTNVLIVGGGVSGLACARELGTAGVDDVVLLELEDEAGGNARCHQMAGMACPLGAHYLPLPGPQAGEVYQLLEEFGLVRQQFGRAVYDERRLCHAPQERLFFEGQWRDGLLPPATQVDTRAQYLRFAAAVSAAQKNLGFAMPSFHAPWTAAHAALDAQTFANWLDAQAFTDPQLRWYLDYCCRDDYGATAAEVSAWAGLHYFASRHGFHPPGDQVAEREAVLTWPEGNAYLTRRMSSELAGRIHSGRTVLRVQSQKHQLEVLAWNEATNAPERWVAQQVVLATPLFIAARLAAELPEALRQAAQALRYAPWLVANLQLNAPLLDRLGVPPAWDNVAYGSSASLGYVDASHQQLDPSRSATVLTAYWALPRAERPALLQSSWQSWAHRVVTELQTLHPDLPQQLQRADLVRWGHAMSIPLPGVRGSAALAALQMPGGQRLHFAHSDLAGYSVFEEAYTQGVRAAEAVVNRATRSGA